jgi:starch synthase
MSEIRSPRSVPLALVHHANQYLITEGYDNRQGVLGIVEGYAALLRLHERYGVCANLHLSGTLIEAVAWHCPWFLTLVRNLRSKGLLALIGGTYSENVMPLFPRSFNVRQLNEHLWLYRRHLDCSPTEITLCWVPERVWDTARLAAVLTDSRLANGGYRFVLLDDRLLYPINSAYPGSARALVDSAGPYPQQEAAPSDTAHLATPAGEPIETASCRICRIADGNGLVVVPMSANLRYWVPPLFPDHWRHLEETVESLAQYGGADTILVYADDMEKTAGVGGWGTDALERYDAFLRWVASRQEVAPVRLTDWLAGHSPREERVLEAGTFFELAREWQAGEDYRGWSESAAWLPYNHYMMAAQDALCSAESAGADRLLLTLAWKHLLASTYETAWHDPTECGRAPAPWARALASHTRACHVMAAAARWFARDARSTSAEIADIDDDGEDEVILRSEYLYAVMTPRHGGRLVYLFTLTSQGGALVIGNPTDDWNFQQELNRYMDQPANHPGALADVGYEHDMYRVSAVGEAGAWVELTNVQHESRLLGARKSLILASDAPALVACYQLPDGLTCLATETALSPDYYHLLREGQGRLSPGRGESWYGCRSGTVAVWLGLDRGEETAWATPARAEVGHGMNVRIQSHTDHFHLVIGCGPTDDEQCQRLIQAGRNAIHRDWRFAPPRRALPEVRRGGRIRRARRAVSVDGAAPLVVSLPPEGSGNLKRGPERECERRG